MKSFKSVTSCVKQGTVGSMTLIDTPGLNDPDAKRTDKITMIETIKNLSPKLYDPLQGISSLILCIMPNAAQRITDSTVKAIVNNFFTFNSLDVRVDITNHPKFLLIINNVSRYGENYDPHKILNDPSYVPPVSS